jgi:hypothetical protein
MRPGSNADAAMGSAVPATSPSPNHVVQYKRARTREYLFQGVQAFRLSQAVEAVPALLHVAVFLFFAGLVDFLFSIDSTVGRVIFGVMCFFGGIYVLLTFLPNFRPNCPYRTPFSRDSLKWLLLIPTASAFLGIYCLRCFVRSETFERILGRSLFFAQSLLWTMSDAMRWLQEGIDKKALQWTVVTVDDDDDIETLLEGIPGYLTSGRNALSIVEGLLDLQQPKPLGYHINRLIQTCTREGDRAAAENVRRHRALICLDTTRFLTGVYYFSFSYGMFGYQTWPSVNSLKRDDEPVIAINAISTGALAARAYLRSVVFIEGAQQAPAALGDHAQKLFEFVNAPWPKDRLYSYAGCHLLVLHGFISALLPHLSSEEAVPSTSFRAVWETLPRILNKYPRGSNAGDLEPHVKKSFLDLWAELGTLAGTEPPPAMPWGSVMISGSEPIRFKKRVMDADGVSPVVQLMSMLRETVERLRMQDAQTDNGGVQETQGQARARDAALVEEAVPPPAAAATEQVGQSVVGHVDLPPSSVPPAPNSVSTSRLQQPEAQPDDVGP